MSIRNIDKDHLKHHAHVHLVSKNTSTTQEDALRFWTHNTTEKTLVDLREFAVGTLNRRANSKNSGTHTPFSGRPELILELAAPLQARLALMRRKTVQAYLSGLRKFWRVLDSVEASESKQFKRNRVESIKNLSNLHGLAFQNSGIDPARSSIVISLLNDARRLMHLPRLNWASPSPNPPDRRLIPEDQAKEISTAIKRDWEAVRNRWERNAAIMRGENAISSTLSFTTSEAPSFSESEQYEYLKKNWLHFERIRKRTGNLLPSSTELYDGWSPQSLGRRGLDIPTMRGIAFPTVEEADIAVHAAILRSGWNPSTMIDGIDATKADRIFLHPKDKRQLVLTTDSVEHISIKGQKHRSGGHYQFSTGLLRKV